MRKTFSGLWRILTAPFRFVARLIRSINRWFKHLSDEVHFLLTEEPEDEPLPDTFVKTMENPMGLMEHISALRKHLLRAVMFMGVTTVFSFIFTAKLIDILAEPIGGIKGLQAIDVTESVGTFMRVALLCGFALALPYIAFELWLFAAPGLSKRSRMVGTLCHPISCVIFHGGCRICVFRDASNCTPVPAKLYGDHNNSPPLHLHWFRHIADVLDRCLL